MAVIGGSRCHCSTAYRQQFFVSSAYNLQSVKRNQKGEVTCSVSPSRSVAELEFMPVTPNF